MDITFPFKPLDHLNETSSVMFPANDRVTQPIKHFFLCFFLYQSIILRYNFFYKILTINLQPPNIKVDIYNHHIKGDDQHRACQLRPCELNPRFLCYE